MEERDTHRQKLLSVRLERSGYRDGWRRYLIDPERRQLSVADLSRIIFRDFSLALDPSTLWEWRRQAILELEGKGVDEERLVSL
ncbi:MAG TPA: hypothetical protein VHK68_00730 [Gemmatimonadales bacterium]|jgi:hypothetical protein|nr:hypothetical protein [Gemmatimonadales bacterium]